jgi:hypothetical protein
MEKPRESANWVERLLARIPGIATYKDRENRRETDKRIREHIASRLQETRGLLQRVAFNLVQKGALDPQTELDRLSSHIQQVADTIRYAAYGYSGIFDHEKIGEDELEQLCKFDYFLLKDAEGLREKVKGWSSDPSIDSLRTAMREAESLVAGLEDQFRRRGELVNHPAQQPQDP